MYVMYNEIAEDVNGWCIVHSIVGIISSFIISVYVSSKWQKSSCKRAQVQVLHLEMIKPREKNMGVQSKKISNQNGEKGTQNRNFIVFLFLSFQNSWIRLISCGSLLFGLLLWWCVYVLHCHKNPLEYVWETWKGENVKICHSDTYYMRCAHDNG